MIRDNADRLNQDYFTNHFINYHLTLAAKKKISVAEKNNLQDGTAKLRGDNIILVETSFIVADD